MITDSTQLFRYPFNLRIPIAARDLGAIHQHVGAVWDFRQFRREPWALIVELRSPIPAPDDHPIWRQPRAGELWRRRQVWVHVDNDDYRDDYERVLPREDIPDLVYDHLCNRDFARVLGYRYLRLCPMSRSMNTAGAGAHGLETQAVYDALGGRVRKAERPETFDDARPYHSQSPSPIAWASDFEICKMLNDPEMLPGGARSPLGVVRLRRTIELGRA